VSRLPFDTTGAAAQAKQLAAAQAAKSRSAVIGYAKTGALALIVLLTVLLTWLKSRKTRKVPVEGADLERIAELERLNAELEAERAGRAIEGAPRGVLALPAAPAHDPEGDEYQRLRNEVGELVDRQPEEVAMLLRGWLADRRG
jgi:flagellar M-ring protein FliF